MTDYLPILPITPALVGLAFRSVPLLGAVPMSEYSVIIPVYNKVATVEKCFWSVLQQNKMPSQIIIVDDQSTDGSWGKVKPMDGGLVEVYENEKNIGKAETINWAMSKVKYPFVLIVDADTYLEKTFAQEALRGFYKSSVQGVCGLVLPNEPKALIQKARLVEYLVARPIKMIQTRIHGIWVLSGCATMWRTDFLRKHPIPSDTVVEDMDITWIAQSKNENEQYQVNFNPRAVAYTEEPKTAKQYLAQISRWFSSRYVIQKNIKKASIGLKATTMWAFGESIAYLGLAGVTLYSLFTGNIAAFSTLFLGDIAISSLIAFIVGLKYNVSKKDILLGIPVYLMMRPVNALVWWKCLFHPQRKWEK
jgi:cellulose synthase/poly-beta-1,6-N-acetylglucosamine synthase-like glycosyltransferase